MLEQHILLAFISIAFLSKACYYFYHLRRKDKGIWSSVMFILLVLTE